MKIYRIANDNILEQSVATIIQNSKNEVLILKRGSSAPWMPNKWNLPGGGVDNDESLEQAAIRECQEETGISIGGLTKISENIDTNENFKITIFYTQIKYTNVNINFESSDYAWVDKNTYQSYDYVPYVKSAISKVLDI
jgi:8-oxo-dGTP diphosphatase